MVHLMNQITIVLLLFACESVNINNWRTGSTEVGWGGEKRQPRISRTELWLIHCKASTFQLPRACDLSPRLALFMKQVTPWASIRILACSYSKQGLKSWPFPHRFCSETRIKTTSLSLNYWSSWRVLSDSWKSANTSLGGGWASRVPSLCGWLVLPL